MKQKPGIQNWKEIGIDLFRQSPRDIAEIALEGDVLHCDGMDKEIIAGRGDGVYNLLVFKLLQSSPKVYEMMGYGDSWIGERVMLIEESQGSFYPILNSEWERKIK